MHNFYCPFCLSPYYETRANYNGLLKSQKLKVNDLESKVSTAKMTYNEALKNLEQISEDIHRQRQQRNNLLNYEAMLRQVDAVDASTATATAMTAATPATITGTAGSSLAAVEMEDSEEEYLRMPDKLSTDGAGSPPRQRQPDPHDCPHLLQDFDAVLTFPQKLATGMPKSASTSATGSDNLFAQSQGLRGPYDIKAKSGSSSLSSSAATAAAAAGAGAGAAANAATGSSSCTMSAADDNDIEQWTEIRLSHSDSTSSSYSNQSLLHDQHGLDSGHLHGGGGSGGGDGCGGLGGGGSGGGLDLDAQSQHSTSSSDEPKRKVTCTTIFQDDSGAQQMSRKQSLSQWLSRSNSFKTAGRRQSLDLLIDAGDKVKDVFSYGFQKVGRSLERRNSESEMNTEGGGSSLVVESTTTTTTAAAAGAGLAAAGTGTGSSSSSSAGDFLFFSRSSDPKELLSDEQVENLLLNHTVDEHGAIIMEDLRSPTATTTTTTTNMHHQQQQQHQHHHPLSVASAARAALLF